MKWLTRPWIMASTSAALVVGAAALILLSMASTPPRAAPLPVAEGDREIVWLYTATSTSSWEQFVVALRRAAARVQVDHPGAQAEIGASAFPKQTTAVPEVALTLPGKAGRLVFRWYKLTSDTKTGEWVKALLTRRPPPLAIIGGSTSHAARELALMLTDQCRDMPETDRPLLLLTTATADRVSPQDRSARPALARFGASALGLMGSPVGPGPLLTAPTLISVQNNDYRSVDLTSIYPDRTFRYCFSNKQMAAAVMRFLMSQDDLRPNVNAVHMVEWDDDSYSHDLTDGFREALPPQAGLTNPERITSSVGSFLAPNPFEFDAVEHVVQDLEGQGDDQPPQNPEGNHGRPLLVVTGQLAPSRRFLRQLARTSPARARRLVVATGDAVSFDTIYRDRRVTWPIQDLPFPLVCFRHFDPVHNKKDDPELGFLPEGVAPPAEEKGFNLSDSGTEEVLLDSAIIESLAQAFDRDDQPAADATELARRLSDIRHRPGHTGYDPEGVPLFGEGGNRRVGAGENIVCLRPHFKGDRVLPEATIEVWVSRESIPGAARPWDLHGDPLTVSYEPAGGEERSGP